MLVLVILLGRRSSADGRRPLPAGLAAAAAGLGVAADSAALFLAGGITPMGNESRPQRRASSRLAFSDQLSANSGQLSASAVAIR